MSDAANRLQVRANDRVEEVVVGRPSNWSMLNAQWEYRTLTFVANASETLLQFFVLRGIDEHAPVLAMFT